MASDAVDEWAEEIPGVTTTLKFADGECVKKIIVEIIDDDLSESDEQVIFVLSDPTAGDLGTGSRAYLNISDNDVNEVQRFEMAASAVNVNRADGKVDITVKRTAGIEKFGSVSVTTAELTAVHNVDYQVVTQDLVFPQGVTERTITIPILNKDSVKDGLQFEVKLSSSSEIVNTSKASTIVTLLSDNASASEGNKVSAYSAEEGGEEVYGLLHDEYGYYKEFVFDQDGAMQAMDGGNSEKNLNASNTLNVNANNYEKTWTINADLSLANKISIDWENNTGGTYWETRGKCNKVTGSGYHISGENWVTFGSDGTWFRPGSYNQIKFGRQTTTMNIPANKNAKRKDSYITVHTKPTGSNRYSNLIVYSIKVYYSPVDVTISGNFNNQDDNNKAYNSLVDRKEWTISKTTESGYSFDEDNNTSYTLTKRGEIAGTLSFTDSTASSKRAYFESTVAFKPNYSLSSDEVYLAGIVISGDTKDKFLEGVTSITLNSDFITNYGEYIRDSYGANPKVTICPVYFPKTSFIYFPTNNDGYMVSHNTKDKTDVMKVSKTDTVKLQNVANKGKFVEGFNIYGVDVAGASVNNAAAENNHKKLSIGDFRKKTFYYSAITDGKGITWNKTNSSFLTIQPKMSCIKIEPYYSNPYLTVMANPRNSNKDQGAVFYESDGSIIKGNSTTPLKIDPMQTGKVYSINSVANSGYTTKWQDFTGISDIESGVLSPEDAKNVEDYHIDRTAVNGTVFNYVAGKFALPIIFYGFYPEYSSSDLGYVEGTVNYVSKPIFGTKATKNPVEGASVYVGEKNTLTDASGNFSLSSSNFADSENASLTMEVNNMLFSYTPSVNIAQVYNIDEYSGIKVVSANLYKDGSAIKATDVENFDAKLKIEIGTKSESAVLQPTKAEFRTYDKNGLLLFTDTVTSKNGDGVFAYEFNPSTKGATIGAKMTVQFFDQNDNGYFVHDLGITFRRAMSTINIAASFIPKAKPVLDIIGAVDPEVDMGLGGSASTVFTTETKTINGREVNFKTMTFGYSAGADSKSNKLDDLASSMKDNIDGKLKKKKGEEPTKEQKEATDEKVQKDAKEVTDTKSDKANKKETKLSSRVKLGFGVGVKVVMRESDVKEGEYCFDELLFTVNCSGSVSVSAKIPTPIGLTINIGFSAGGELVGAVSIRRGANGPESYFDEDGGLNLGDMSVLTADESVSNRSAFTFYGSLKVAPSITISAGVGVAIAEVKVSGTAKFDLNFDTLGDSNGKVNLSAKLEVEILIFKKSWELANKDFALFSADGEDFRYDSLSDMEKVDTSYMKNRGKWNSSAGMAVFSKDVPVVENTLLEGADPTTDGVIKSIGDGKYMYVFIDDNTGKDEYNYKDVKYSVYSNGSWSQPVSIDNDGTMDNSPDLFVLDNGMIMAVWSSAETKVTSEDNTISSLSKMNIKAAIYDGNSFGEPMEVTHTTKADYCADTLPKLASGVRNGKDTVIMYYTKTEYSASDNGDGLIGDIVDPYSLISYMFYDVESGKWETEYSAEDKAEIINTGDARTSDGELVTDENFAVYEQEWYGQGFAKLGSNVIINDNGLTNEKGFWTSTPDVKAGDGLTDPKVIDCDAFTDDNKVFFAYTVDLDQNLETVYDREVYVQVYNFDNNTFYHPIQVTSNDIDDSAVRVGRFGSSVYIVWISDGNIKYLNMTNTYDNCLLEKEVNGQKVYIIDKSDETKYMPEGIIANHGKDRVIGEFDISTDEKNNIAVIWTQTGLTYKEGVEPDSAEATKPENQYCENQIYAAKFNVTDDVNDFGKWSAPVQITDEQGANYSNIAFGISDNGVSAIAAKGKSTYDQQLGVYEDISSRKLVTLAFDVIDKIEITKADIVEEYGDGTFLVEAVVNNKGFEDHEDAYVDFYSNGSKIESVKIDYLDSQNEVKAAAVVPEGDFRIELCTPAGVQDSYEGKAEIKTDLNITALYSEIIARDTAAFTAEIANNSAFDAENVKVVVTCDNTGEQTAEYTVENIAAGQSVTIEFTGTLSDAMFEAADEFEDENNAIEEYAAFTVALDDGETAETSLKRYLTKQEKELIDAADPVINDGAAEISVPLDGYGVLFDSVTSRGSKLQVTWESVDESIARVNENGVVYGVSEGKVLVIARIMPHNRAVVFVADGSGNPVDIYSEIPEDGIITRTIVVNVGKEASDETGTEATTESGTETTTRKSSSSGGGGGGGGGGSSSSKAASQTTTEAEAATEATTSDISEGGNDGTEDKTETPVAARFNDIAGHWAEKTIELAAEKGIVSGYEDNSFKPNKSITRAEFVAMLYNSGLADTESTGADVKFKDFTGSEWYAKYLTWAVGNGIIEGYDDNTFRGENIISRQEMAVVVSKFIAFAGLELENNADITFADEADIAAWAKPYVEDIAAKAVVKGDNYGKFNPKKDLTRAETAVIVTNIK